MANSSTGNRPQTLPPPIPPRREEPAAECLHRTKSIHFFGRPTPILLQNDNGPCPLLAICNVLLLKNQLNLNTEIRDVSQEKLLSLVAERLLDSNSNFDNKDAPYIKNLQQNFGDAMDLLPRLTTGVDVNVKFRRIDDFEFTRECAIFDLLDIPLYHGWLVDPQDYETAKAVGSKSYNTITRDLVLLQETKGKSKDKTEEDSVPATTKTLEIPSPCFSKDESFNDSPRVSFDRPTIGKGDAEEEAELLRILELSKIKSPCAEDLTANSDTILHQMAYTSTESADNSQENHLIEKVHAERPTSGASDSDCNNSVDVVLHDDIPSSNFVVVSNSDQPSFAQTGEHSYIDDLAPSAVDSLVKDETKSPSLLGQTREALETQHPTSTKLDSNFQILSTLETGLNEETYKENTIGSSTSMSSHCATSSGNTHNNGATESCNSTRNSCEGEECIDGSSLDVYDLSSNDEITLRDGELINNFLQTSASQLTIYGLFSLQEGLKERELCVLFRNNHFSTAFKFQGGLYMLTTDQGYLDAPGIVWEKLNEISGASVFCDSNFKDFMPESQANGTWGEENTLTSTADYLPSTGNFTQDSSSFDSDMQLARALQEQENEQQQQRQLRATQQPRNSGRSGLITGPQTSGRNARTSTSSLNREKKPKDDGCSIM